ncbi:MAG: porin family protein [Acinetobacter sp.]|nr:porin family protein [Acinetobacter sp.]
MPYKISLLTACLAISSHSLANAIDTAEQTKKTAPILLPVAELPAELNSTPTVTNHEQQPFAQLNQAVLNKNVAQIEQLLPSYRQQHDADPILIQYAEAVLLEKQGKLKTAIAAYRKIIAQKPELTPIRYELAKLLFEDQQTEAAKAQFNKIKSNNPPAFVLQVSDAYLHAIQKRQKWQVDFGVNYVQEDNVNNASSAEYIENTPFLKNKYMLPQSAQGVSYQLGVKRDFNLHNNHYLHLETEVSGKHYWNNQDYSDVLSRTSIGYVQQASNHRAAILPFYEKRWYATEPYKQSVGVRAEYTQWVTPNWQLSSAAEYSKNRYNDQEQLNGENRFFSLTGVWLRNPKQYFYLGTDLNQERMQVASYSSDSPNLRLGWGQEWPLGISTRAGVSVGKRTFKDTAVLGGLIPLLKVRQDKEYSANLTLWKRDWHYWGITPKLTYVWRKVDSNIESMYSIQQGKFFMSFEKAF